MADQNHQERNPLDIFRKEMNEIQEKYSKELQVAKDKLQIAQLNCKHPTEQLKKENIAWESGMRCQYCGAIIDESGAHEYYGPRVYL